MDHFQSYLNQPLFSTPDDLSFADCELYPPEVEVDPYTSDRTSHLRQHLSKIEDSANGYYFPSPYPGPSSFHSGAIAGASSNEPFADKIVNCFKEVSTLKPPPAHSKTGPGYSHSDAFASPWTAHLSSPPALDSPCSSSNWGNIGCYMSPPPFASEDVMIPPVDEYGYPSPGVLAAVAPHQVQIEPDHPSMEADVHMENQPIPLLDCLNDDSDPGAVIQTSLPLEDIVPIEKELLARSPRPIQPKPKRSLTDGVHKPKRGPLHHHHHQHHNQQRHTRTASHIRNAPAPTSAPPKSPGKPAAARSRLFTCSFAEYGCDSTFSSKNEWKRHVASQHLQLGFYRCDVDKCNIDYKGPNHHSRQHHKKSRSNHSDDAACRIANDFNRKDLFTQHLRRMHPPWLHDGRTSQPRSPLNKEREAFERSLDDIRERCWHQQRKPPVRSQCGFCGQNFRGEYSWDERMEHVGRHHERDEQPAVEMEDVGLREWAIREGIIRPVEGKGWILTSLCE